MSKHAQIAHLTWLRSPIQKSIEAAKIHLDAYHKKVLDLLAPPSDAQPIWFKNQETARDEALARAIGEVALIHSATVVTECKGAVALAHEVKILLSNIQNGIQPAGRGEDALLSAMNGLLAIPKYLSMIIDGAPDTAVILAKQINEIRELRGVQLLQEDNMLPGSVEFAFIDPPHKDKDCASDVRNRAFANAPKRFLPAFSSFMSKQNKDALAEMKSVLRELQVVTYDREVGCFWWVGECLLDALDCGAIRSAGNTMTQIRTLSVAIQKGATGGEEAAKDTLGAARFKSLLGVLMMSSRLPEDIQAALASFNVHAATDQSQLTALQARLDQIQPDSLDEVIGELKPLIQTSMVALGRAIASKSQESFDNQFTAFQSTMRQITSVLFMVNEDNLAAVAANIIAKVERVSSPSALSEPSLLEALKNDVMFLDQRVQNMNPNDVIRSLNLTNVSPEVIEAVLGTAVQELAVTRRLIAQHMDSNTGAIDLRAGLGRLITTANALSFSGMSNAGQVLQGACQGFINLLEGDALKASTGADLAARALVAVETYLSFITARLTPSPLLLTRAEEGLAELGIHIEHTEAIATSDLIALFEQAQASDEPEDPFLAEMLELRSSLEQLLPAPSVTTPASMDVLFRAADRLSIAGKLYGHEFFYRLARSLSLAAAELRENTPKFDQQAQNAQHVVKSGVEMTLRCMDDYSARGTVALYTREIESELLKLAGIEEEISSQEATTLKQTHEPTPHELTPTVNEPEVILASESQPRSYPDGVDGVLMEIFREEFATSLRVLTGFCDSDNYTVNRDVRRAAHSILGNSSNVDCKPLQQVFGALEERLDSLAAEDIALTAEDVSRLRLMLDDTGDFIQDFPWTTESPLVGEWLDTVASLGRETLDQATSVAEEAPVIPEILHAETLSAVASSDSVQEIAPAPAIEPPTREYNEEYGFYIDEADDVLPSLQSNVQAWLGDMSNKALVSTIKRQMHTLKGAALMAEAESIGAITHSMESLFESLAIQLIAPDDDCAQLVSFALDSISSLTALMRRELPYSKPTQLIACLEHAVDNNKIDLSLLFANSPDHVAPVLEVQQANEEDEPEALEAEPAVLSSEDEPHHLSEAPQEEVAETAQENDDAKPALGDSAAADATGATRRKSRRGGRGKGHAKRHEQIRSASSENTSQPSSEESLPALAVANTKLVDEPEAGPDPILSAQVSLESVHQVAAEEIAAEAIEVPQTPEPFTAVEENIPHAETSVAKEDSARQRYEREAVDEFNSRYSLDEIESEPDLKPVTSGLIRNMLTRAVEASAPGVKIGTLVASEKIKVDLKLLETAAEQSSELTAIRHRLAGLNEDLLMSLTAIRERFDACSLQQGQFTTALRGLLNSQPSLPNNEDRDLAGLERFNDLSALHVGMVAGFDDIREEFADAITLSRQVRSALREQGDLISNLQRDLLDSRLVPFMTVKPRLVSAVKQAMASTKKTVELNLIGAEVIMDRMILDNITEPLTHILRNAVDHGIESKEQRDAAGKPATGTIAITVSRRAKNVVISVVDDGKGIDVQAVRRKAIEKKIISESDELTDKEIMRLITANGFSTAENVTSVSGRGVGMDIVAAAVDSLGGQLHIGATAGQGTTFTIELPFTIGANKAMMVSSGSQWFAIQGYSISQILMTSTSALETMRESNGFAVVEYQGDEYEVVHLADLIAMPDSRGAPPKQHDSTLILCAQGDTRIAVEVAQVDSMPEIHIRKLEGILSQVRGIVGETERQDGTVVFVLDVIELARLNLKRTQDGYQVRQNRVRSMKRDQKPVVMVIDDSRGFRTMLERQLTGFGYIVVSAINGQDALDKLPLERGPDLFIVDIEMPIKTGFEFTDEVRRNPVYKDIPIIMISTKYEFEGRAKAAGVNEFLKKPFNVPELEKAITAVKANVPRETVA